MNKTLTAELEAATLRALSEAWDQINWERFHRRMRAPTLALSDNRSRLGQWLMSERTIEIGRHALTEHSWGVLLEVLKHEMAHQYVDEVLGVHDETAHGKTFHRVCEERGIDARAAGVPDAAGDAGHPHAAVLSKIAKLLALAESPNEHEAQAAMNAAQKLMLKHNIDAVSKKVERGYSFRHLGEPTSRVEESRRILAMILSEHFFVEAIWVPEFRPLEGRAGTVLEVCGTHDNLEMAEYVWSFLTHTADALWVQYKRANGIRADRDRRTFLAGVMLGFHDKLNTEKRSNDEVGLVWVGDPALQSYFRGRYPRIRTVRAAGGARTEAREHGREAGRSIVLHKGLGGSAPAGPRQLGPGR